MSSISVNTITDASGGATTSINGFTPSVSNMGGKNRIINGDMRIDQRNAGAAVTGVGQAYGTDRWRAQIDVARITMQQSTDAPAGFTNSLSITCTTASTSGQAFIVQVIEGYNFADFQWGTSNAKPVTISFWVKCSLAGQHTCAFEDSDGTRCYSAIYYINTSDTWEYKTITIPGVTSGSLWNKTNGNGTQVIFDLGSASTQTGNVWGTADAKRATGSVQVCSTVGAVFKVTGVQVEAGSVATPFEHRQYGQELALCQRYALKLNNPTETYGIFCNGAAISTTDFYSGITGFNLRATPTVTFSFITLNSGGPKTVSNVTAFGSGYGTFGIYSLSSGLSPGYSGILQQNGNTAGYILLSSEL